jgi:hypothetical protein
MTKAVRSVEMKNIIFCFWGNFFAANLHADRMAYSKKSAERPIAASSFVLGRPLRVLMTTRYVDARESNPVIPMRVGTWPTAMFKAEPVIKAEMETRGIKSTIHPHLASPIAMIMQPEITAKADAITWPGMVGWVLAALVTILPTRVDITATGCE